MVFRFRVHDICGFRVQRLQFVGVLNGLQGLFQGLQHLGFLKFRVQVFLGFQVSDLGFQVRVFLGFGFQVNDFTQFFRVLGFWFFRVLYVQGLGFFLCFQGLAYMILCFIGLIIFQVCLCFFRFRVYEFLGFRVQCLGFCRSFEWFLVFILGSIEFRVS